MSFASDNFVIGSPYTAGDLLTVNAGNTELHSDPYASNDIDGERNGWQSVVLGGVNDPDAFELHYFRSDYGSR